MLPDIVREGGRRVASTCIFERASVSEILLADTSPERATSFMIEVPIKMRSPSFNSMLRIFSPLTKVPLVEPKSAIVMVLSLVVIFACLRETMSSTNTMSKSDERPIMISRLGRSGNSPPWYFPEMKRNAQSAESVPPLLSLSCTRVIRL